MGSTPLGYCWFIYKIGARTGRLTGQFETYALRIGALQAFVSWLRSDKAGAEKAWRLRIAPLFQKVWPKERKYRDVSLNPYLIDLAVGIRRWIPYGSGAAEALHGAL